LQSVLNFMYHGEVNVAQDELNSFLAVAEDLRVKGLTQSNQTSSASSASVPSAKHSSAAAPASSRSPPPSSQKLSRPPPDPPSVTAPPPKRPRPTAAPPSHSTSYTQPVGTTGEDDEIQEVVPVKSEPRELVAPSGGGGGGGAASAAGADAYANALATEDDGAYDESYEDYGQYDQSYDGTLADPSMSADGNKGRT
jgi:hypothetical protein